MLSPEERKKIYEEEKFRLESKAKIEKEKKDTEEQDKKKKQEEQTKKRCLGCLSIFGIILFFSLMASFCSENFSNHSPSPSYKTKSSAKPQDDVINVWSGEHLKGSFSIKEVTIIKTKQSANSYTMIIKWENGSISKNNLIKNRDKYVDTGSSFGEYQKIDPSGKLMMYDQDGLIYVLPEK